MISINILFIFFSGLVFLGFILNSLFSKIKIAGILPLMIIGLLIGPIFKIIPVNKTSIIMELTPLITALALSFILFDVGLNLNFEKLKNVLLNATKFTFITVIITGLACSVAGILISFFVFHWSLIISFMFGFAIAGPGTIIVPILARISKITEDLKTILIYEAVGTSIVTLIIPLILSKFLCAPATVCNTTTSLSAISMLVFNTIITSSALAIVLALFWLFILNKFKEYSKEYMWMLTMTIVLATYGISQSLGFNGVITVFIFGLVFANIGTGLDPNSQFFKYFSLPHDIAHIRSYQKEIVFFVSTFFFLYLGMLFEIPSSYSLIGIMAIIGVIVSLIILGVRYLFTPLLKNYLSIEKEPNKVEHNFINFDIARGLSPAIIATIPLSLGLNVPGFVDQIFFIILITNIISTLGIFFTYKEDKLKIKSTVSINTDNNIKNNSISDSTNTDNSNNKEIVKKE